MSREPPLDREIRRQNLERLRSEAFDVLILGGGINGAGIARDLSLRGAKTALVEQRHFASGTSGKNSQLIHGGLRYLKQLQFHLVREALRERATLLRIAPHLVTPQPFLIPMYGRPARLFYGAGLWLYDLLAGSSGLAHHCILGRGDVSAIEPGLAREGLTHAAIFFDCQVNSARFVIENIWDAARHGAVVANYMRADYPSGRVILTDTLSGESFPVRAAKLVNATGAWARGENLRLVRGSHIIIPRVNSSGNAIAYFDEAGRIVFIIPWGAAQQLSLVGTTDVDHTTGPDNVRISPQETDYLQRIVRRLFPSARDVDPISSFSALRPLIRGTEVSATKVSREHRIWMSEDAIVHVAGGKYTTYRAMSEEAANLLSSVPAQTARTPLGGNTKARIDELLASVPPLAAQHFLSEGEIARVIRNYGVLAPHVLAYLPEAPPAGLTRLEVAQIAFAAEHEMAQTLDDLLSVSTYWRYERKWSRETLAPITSEMGRRLGWDSSRIEREISGCL